MPVNKRERPAVTGNDLAKLKKQLQLNHANHQRKIEELTTQYKKNKKS